MELTLMVFCALCVTLCFFALAIWRLAELTRKFNNLVAETARLKEDLKRAYDNGYRKGQDEAVHSHSYSRMAEQISTRDGTYSRVVEKVGGGNGGWSPVIDDVDFRRMLGR